ncbi:hypothetical protein DYB25_006519 [Aphanomyces astaci]|uniref:Uncharacterized protein n=2 Tax=Aphanomyces astaci TaxID=112090 RepID=A0A397CEF5_APHAT|nr:hypothetical protein DYB25_006519 [Aphanomyces astaci]RHY41486.1 hypothetical protein DYB38_002420 [Aphanomyces astaci]RHY96835.1 hypothetical protein DYB35_003077 [Aphanomyces astaci]RHZ16678.1 hypothetical protein DYB26_011224 [Aphanomyces astaci]
MTATTYRSEFLRIMDDFSSDSCDATEIIERVKSLQDADDNICYYDVDDTFWTNSDDGDLAAINAVEDMAVAVVVNPPQLNHGFEDVLQHVHLSLCEDDEHAFATCLGPSLLCDDDLDMTGFGSGSLLDSSEPDEFANSSAIHDNDVFAVEDDTGVWWGEVDEQGLLDSIDHRAICDKSNRFLGQWPATCVATKKDEEGSARPPMPVTPPPRHDVADSSTRMVNHILASCLKKRKLHVPYKNNVKLINFSPTKIASSFDGVNLDLDLDEDDFTIRPTSVADPILLPPPSLGVIHVPTSTSSMMQLSSQTPTMSKARDVQHLRVGIIQPNAAKDKKIDSLLHPARKQLPTQSKMKANGLPDQHKRKHTLLSLGTGSTNGGVAGGALSSLSYGISSEDDDDDSYDMMVVDQDILDLGNSITASMSRIVRPKQECLPLPDFGNMPQDLRELKLKIEATECKVEGTKHRHRKGGPCPRCQVQNQLRAAKRALLCRMKRYK